MVAEYRDVPKSDEFNLDQSVDGTIEPALVALMEVLVEIASTKSNEKDPNDVTTKT